MLMLILFPIRVFSGNLSKVNDVEEIANSNKIEEDVGLRGFANKLFDQFKYFISEDFNDRIVKEVYLEYN